MSAPRHTAVDTNGNLWTIPAGSVRAIDRFNPDGPTGYQSSDGGPIRATREEAVQDWMRARRMIPKVDSWESVFAEVMA